MRVQSSLYAAVAVWVVVLQLVSASPPDPCDPNLVQPSANPYGYRIRGDRCEGVYVRQVGNSALLLTSFTLFMEDYDIDSTRDLLVEWKAPANTEVQVRARSLDRRLYYRMDAVRPPGVPRLSWPNGLLAGLRIHRPNLGILAWSRVATGTAERLVYLPVQVRQKRDESSSGKYQVALLPGLELSEVYISLSKVDEKGRKGVMIRDGEALGYGYYPADRKIDFSIANPGSTGIYYLEIGASLKAGGSVTLPVWFYHSD